METLALISGITLTKFAYFMMWAFYGQVIMIVVQQKKYFLRIKNYEGFSMPVWLKENGARVFYSFITALVLSPVAVLTIMKAPEGIGEFAAVGAGAMIDKTVESFTNKKK